jgi:hypothetical protein
MATPMAAHAPKITANNLFIFKIFRKLKNVQAGSDNDIQDLNPKLILLLVTNH